MSFPSTSLSEVINGPDIRLQALAGPYQTAGLTVTCYLEGRGSLFPSRWLTRRINLAMHLGGTRMELCYTRELQPERPRS